MDKFHESASELKLGQIFIVGASFGIFLTFGQAWTVFIQSMVVAITPTELSPVLKEFIFACITSVICVLLIIFIIYLDRQINHVNTKISKRLTFIRANTTTYQPRLRRMNPPTRIQIDSKK